MNENCRIGLHSFGEWRDKDREGFVQTRLCRQCPHIEERPYRSDAQFRPPYDPYRDLC